MNEKAEKERGMVIYRVRYEEQLDASEEWFQDIVTVAAGQDAQAAVDKARTHILAQEWDTDDDPPKKEKALAFRLISVEAVVEVDVV